MPGVEIEALPSGSRADVRAEGKWLNGYWTVELSRKLDTGDRSDISFIQPEAVTFQLAFFNSGYKLRKQITSAMTLRLNSEQLAKATVK